MKFRNKKVLVTGGAGFIGSRLVDRLVEEGAKVTVLDDLFTGRKENIGYLTEIEFVNGSVTDFKLVSKLVKKADYVFNLAVRNIIVSTASPQLDFQVNTGGIFNILNAAKDYPVERVVYTSSVSVYGNPKYLPINEDDRLYSLNPYAASKQSGENYCNAFHETYGVSTAILRFSNVYGVNQMPQNPYCGVISKFFSNVMEGKPPLIHGDGLQTRDFTYVDDAVEAVLKAALSPKAEGQTFNVGTGFETSINHLAQLIMQIAGYDVDPVYVDKRDIDNIRRRVVNIEKIRRTLRWTPTVTLSKGLEKTYEWLASLYPVKKGSKGLLKVTFSNGFRA
ncbi:hypothetical protein DRQ07_06210 [candidate division KSB1 bacterium]|nr:MAG: hypothetical protein DRQ07_06210 [candidate division KSB1 bacterium]